MVWELALADICEDDLNPNEMDAYYQADVAEHIVRTRQSQYAGDSPNIFSSSGVWSNSPSRYAPSQPGSGRGSVYGAGGSNRETRRVQLT